MYTKHGSPANPIVTTSKISGGFLLCYNIAMPEQGIRSYWLKQQREAQLAVTIAETHLLRIQTVGQLTLFANERQPFPTAPGARAA